jgi:hypothetical protein
MASYSGNKKIATESVYVLNDKYQYVAFDQTANAKWLDLDNVLSVKRDKTIYAIRARNTFDFKTNSTNSEFFCNVALETSTNINSLTNKLTSNIFRNFNSTDNIFLSDQFPMYGNLNAGTLVGNIGLAGSLKNGFVYNPSALTGNINVQSNISIFANSLLSNETNVPTLSGFLKLDGLTKQLSGTTATGYKSIGNAYSIRNLKYSEDEPLAWNRLINANINGNVMVTASTDPCDINGNALPLTTNGTFANSLSNEAYRLQFQLKKNLTQTRSSENPIYIGRVSRFGTHLSDISGTLSKNLAIHSFESNFFSNLPVDNSLYNNANVLTQMTINGNYTNAALQVFNANYTDSNIGNLDGGNLLGTVGFTTGVSISSLSNSFYGDYIANANLSTQMLSPGDRFTVVETNIGLSQPLYLFDRITPSVLTSDYVNPSLVFGNATTANTPLNSSQNLFFANANIRNLDGTSLVDSKVVYMQFYGVVNDNWKTTSSTLPSETVLPKGTTNPNMAVYNSANSVSLYLRRGGINFDNYVNITTRQTTGSKYFSSIPSYLKSYEEPSLGIYIQDETVTNTSTSLLSNVANQVSKTLNIDSQTGINANITNDLCFYVFGNSQEDDRINKSLNTVLGGKSTSIIANVWSYTNDSILNTSSVKFYPKIVYGTLNTGSTINPSTGIALPSGGTVKALTLANDFSKTNITYKVKFGKVLGEHNLQNEQVTPLNFGFYANLTHDGSVVSTNLTSNTNLNLINNHHMNDLLLNGVAFSEFEFSNFSYKFTDLGNIMRLDNTNYKFTSLLPYRGNLTGAFTSVNDNFINVIADYNGTEIMGNDTDVHRLTVYDTQYRYYINDIQRTGAGPLNNNFKSGTSSDLIGNIFVNNATLHSGNVLYSPDVATSGSYINPGSFVLFTYEKVYENSSKDSFYPFYSVNDIAGRTSSTVQKDDNYLFPGFIYKKSGESAEFYNYKDETNADFVISNNTSVEQSLSLMFFGIDSTNKTVKVALSSESGTKSVDIRPIQFGKGTYYSPIVFKISGDSNSYVVLLYKLDGLAGTSLSSSYSSFLPASVNMRVIEKSSDGHNQIQFKSSLRVYDSTGVLTNSYSNNIVNQKTKLSLFSYSSTYGSNDTNLGINVFSIPPNNTIIQMAYNKTVLKKVISYARSDYEINNNVDYDQYKTDESKIYSKIPNSISGILFATSKSNTQLNAIDDDDRKLPKILANTTRFYLDQGYSNGVYIDIDNNSTLTPDKLGKFRINRGVEWILTRKSDTQTNEETVGRGLMSRTSSPDDNEDITNKLDYFIFENMGKLTSGFYMKVNTNIIDLATHLLVQGKLTSGTLTADRQFVLTTKPDVFSVSLYHENPNTYAKTLIGSSKTSSSKVVDLSELFTYINPSDSKVYKSRLPKFEFENLRGLTFGKSLTDLSNAIFRIRLRLDNYAMVYNKLTINQNDILYTSGTKVLNTSFGLTLDQNLTTALSVNSNFLLVTEPVLTNDNFNLISSYKHEGFGKVRYQYMDFTSNYDNELHSQIHNSGSPSSLLSPYYYPTNKAFQFTVPTLFEKPAVDIQYDTVIQRFFVDLGTNIYEDKLYFSNSGLTSQPKDYNNKSTAILYTGSRPIGFITYDYKGPSVNLADFMKTNVINFKTSDTKIFNSMTTSDVFQYNTTSNYNIYYSVALTNSNNNGKLNVRGISYDFTKSMYLTSSSIKSTIFGVSRSSLSLLNNLTMKNTYGVNQTQTINLTTKYVGNSYLPTLGDNDLYSSASNPQSYMQFQLSLGNDPLFKLQVLGSSPDTPNFSINVNPSKLHIYEAIDVNENGELDINKSESLETPIFSYDKQTTVSTDFQLTNSFSELLFDLKSAQTSGSYRRPALVQTINLTDEFANITGSGMDIKLNKKWAIGYNLDCFFVIRHNNLATFDIITIETDNQSNINNTNSTSLRVGNNTPLIIGNSEDWSRKRTNNSNSLPYSGLTFKINKDVKINAGDVVKLFVDNTPLNNTLSLDVVVAGKPSTSYSISDYDQETYARLLDTQVRTNNKLK